MPSFKYNPSPEEPDVIRTQNRTFTRGEAFDIEDNDPLLRKLRGHPMFEERGAKGSGPEVNRQQAEQNAKAVDRIEGERKTVGEARAKAQEALARAEADERRIQQNERAMNTLSPSEQRAMEQVRGVRGEDGPPVPGEPGYGQQAGEVRDDVSGGGVTGTPGIGGPNQQAKAENRPQ
jgi:hypothetical protein